MSLSAIMNSTTLYIAVIVGLLLIFLLCAVMLKMAWGRCIELGISREKVKDVIKSSVIFSIVPSLSIVIGLFSLAAVLGVPWPWFRLSVVGSVSYELMAADMVATGAGYESIGALADRTYNRQTEPRPRHTQYGGQETGQLQWKATEQSRKMTDDLMTSFTFSREIPSSIHLPQAIFSITAQSRKISSRPTITAMYKVVLFMIALSDILFISLKYFPPYFMNFTVAKC